MNTGTATTLDEKLRDAGRLVQWSAGVAAGLLVVAALIGTLLLVIGVDAVLALPPVGLIVLNGLLFGACLFGVVYAVRRWHAHRYRPRWVARRLEERGGLGDNRLINALDLREGKTAAGGGLRGAVVTRGEAAAAGLKPGVAVDRRPLWVGGRYAVIAAVLLGGLYVLLPGLFHAVVPRLAQPFADHPPFTLVRFEVGVNPEEVIHGQPATIHAMLSGPRAIEQAEVVFVDEGQRQPVAMTRQAVRGTPARAGLGAAASGGGGGEQRFALHLDRAEVSREFYIDTPHGRSKRYRLEVRPVPLFEEAEMTYRYPAYTGWTSVTQPMPRRAVRVLVGTELAVSLTSNVPLRGGVIRAAGGEGATPMAEVAGLVVAPSDPLRATGFVTVERDAVYEIELEGRDGLRSPEPMRFEVIAVEDAGPDLFFNKPQARVVAPPHWTVEVEVVARDDIGVDRVELHRGINGWGPSTVAVELDPPSGTRAVGVARFDLEALGVRAGDVITYFAVGYDNHPTEPRTAETEVYAIQVVSREEWLEHRRMTEGLREVRERVEPLLSELQAMREEREALLDELAELEEQIESGEGMTPEQAAAMEEMEQRLRDYAEAAEALAEKIEGMAELDPVYDFEARLQEEMRAAAEGLREQQEVAGELSERLAEAREGGASLPGMAPLITRFVESNEPWGDEQEAPLEQVEADLDRLAAAAELSMEAERVRWVVVQQRSLAQRLAVFRKVEKLDTTQQLRAARLAKEQTLLREELAAAQARLAELSVEHAERLPRMSGGAARLAERIEALRVLRDQDSASRLAEAGEGRYAAIAAEEAADKLETLLSDCKNVGQQGPADLDGCLNLPREVWANQLAQLSANLSFGTGPQGGSGYGMGGSMARMAVAGSPQGGEGDSEAEASSSRRPGGAGGAGGGADAGDVAGAAEQVNPDETRTVTGINRVLPGVPARYREEAEAYFRRLADEARSD
ncbi:MAG: hypothetical protein AAF750_03005 [Planctomycetota bacterium]